MKDFADDNLKFEENGRKLFKPVENTVGKGEIARYEQFLLFSQCFQKAFSQGRQKVSLCENGLIDHHTMMHFDTLKIYNCGNIVRKGEIACNKQFLFFSQCFLPYMALTFHFKCTLKCRLQFVSI